jgi:hypothetical protein
MGLCADEADKPPGRRCWRAVAILSADTTPRRLAAALAPAAKAFFKVRREAARRHLPTALHARDLLHRRGRVCLAKHICRAARTGQRVERPRRCGLRRRRARREPQLGLAMGLDRDLGRCRRGAGEAWLERTQGIPGFPLLPEGSSRMRARARQRKRQATSLQSAPRRARSKRTRAPAHHSVARRPRGPRTRSGSAKQRTHVKKNLVQKL